MPYHLDDEHFYTPPSGQPNPFHNYSIKLDVNTPLTFTFTSTTNSSVTFYFKIPAVSANREESASGLGYGGRTINYSGTNSSFMPGSYPEDPSNSHIGWQQVLMQFSGGTSTFTISGTGDSGLMGDDKTLCYLSGLTINGQNIDLSLWFNNQNGQLADWVDPTQTANYAASLTPPNFLCTQSTGFIASWPTAFTLEGWVQTNSGGPLFTTLESPNSFNAQSVCDVAVMINKNGSLLFGVNSLDANAQHAYQELLTDPTEILDGEWHHVAAVRQGTTPVLYLDGKPVKGQMNSGPQSIPLAISAQGARFTVGGAPPPYSTYLAEGLLHFDGPSTLQGSVDDVRMWEVAVSADDIASRMHEQLTNREPGLIGHWTFDNQNLADSSTPGGHDFACLSNDSTIQPTVGYVQSEVDFAPPGEPYLLTRAALMQDYQPPTGGTGDYSHITGYRVMISAKDGSGRPYLSLTEHAPATIKLWAASALNIIFMDGTTATLGPTNGYQTTTDYAGELTFVANANDQLTCPMIFVNASFMTEQERLVIFPDRHAHITLASLTGAQLAGTAPLPNGNQTALVEVSGTMTQQKLNGAAQAISTLMNTGADLGLQSGSTPPQSSQPIGPPVVIGTQPTSMSVAIPYRARYQNPRLLPSSYNFATDAIRTHYLNSGDAGHNVERVLVPKKMPTRNWHFDLTTCTFTPLAAGEAPPLSAGVTVQPLDHVSPSLDDAPPVNTTAEVSSEAVTNDPPAPASGGPPPSNAPSILSRASGFVISVLEDTINLAGSIVETVEKIVITVYQGMVSVANWTLRTIEDAILIVSGVLKSIGSNIVKLVKFVRNLFNWEDILVTQRVLVAALNQLPALTKTALSQIETAITQQLSNASTAISNAIASAARALESHSAPSPKQNTPEQNSENIQGKYLNSLVSGNLNSQGDPNNPPPTMNMPSGASQNFSNFAAQDFSGIQSLATNTSLQLSFSDIQSLAGTVLARILRALEPVVAKAIDLIQAGIHGFFLTIGGVIDAILAVGTTRIYIPLVTEFYEKIVMQNQGEMTIFGLLSLLAAIPYTVVYKLISGQPNPPFTEADIQTVSNPNWSGYANLSNLFGAGTASASGGGGGTLPMAMSESGADDVTGSSTPVSLWHKLGWGYNWLYAGSTMIWGRACFLEDCLYVAGLNNLARNPFPAVKMPARAAWNLKMVSQLAANLTSIPFALKGNTNQSVVNVTALIYAGGWSAMLSNFFAMPPVPATPSNPNPAPGVFGSWGDRGDPLATGLYGVGQLLGYAYLTERAATTPPPPPGTPAPSVTDVTLGAILGFGEALEWFPQLIKLIPSLTTIKLAIPAADFVSYNLVAATTLVITGKDMYEKL